MVTYKRLGLFMQRADDVKGWRISNKNGELFRAAGNKGQVMDAFLRQATGQFVFKAGRWEKDADYNC